MSKHLERIHSLPCCVCVHLGMPIVYPTFAHHIESVRDRDSDFAAVPLCHEHHQGANGIHGLSRSGFERRYKLSELDLMKLTLKLLEKHGYLR